MKKFLPSPSILLILLFKFLLVNNASAQSCSGLSFTYTSLESRCMSTGSITVTITNGTGNYNYKVIGPVSTPFTSSNAITGLEPGTYQVIVRDIDNNCSDTISSAIVTGTYSDPRFQLNKTDVTCLGNDGTIDVYNVQYGRSPFNYTIIAPSPSNVGVNNTTGQFTNLTPGEYAIQLRDSCGGIQVRRVTIENYSWWIDNVSVTKVGCDSADVILNLRDNKGNVNNGSPSFAGFTYGLIKSLGDTLWKTNKNFRFYLGTNPAATFAAKDNCGNVLTHLWNVPNSTKPSLNNSVAISNTTCTSFTASVTGQQNLNSPNYCLYDTDDNLISCNPTGSFDNLLFGSYCIKTINTCYDTTIVRCFTQAPPVPSVDANVNVSNFSCTTFTGNISGQTNLINPTYCLFDENNNPVGSCNSTGQFNGLPYGTYTIAIENGCNDTTITRIFTATLPIATITNVSMGNLTCSDFSGTVQGNNLINAEYCLYDDNGNILYCGNNTGVFDNLTYGSYCVRAISCGDTSTSYCFNSDPPTASVNANVQILNKNCDNFSARITGQTNLIGSNYCLYADSNSVTPLECNSTGEFDSLDYGDYCIRIINVCLDTAITRCFSASRPQPQINGTIAKSDFACSTFTATVSGSNLTNPIYSIYDSTNTWVATNSTGIFTTLPYGRYCGEIHDGCIDTTMQVCETITVTKSMAVTVSNTCAVGYTGLTVRFNNSIEPYTINVYDPDDSLIYTTVTNYNPHGIDSFPDLASGLKYKVVGMDNCGFKDSVLITPIVTSITKSISVISKCPSSQWQDGSGDMTINCFSNLYPVYPAIIKKNSVTFNQGYSSNTGNNFVFSDMEPATYIIAYSMQNCSGKVYDMVAISPYVFPYQNKSSAYQCDNNSFSLGAIVAGGVGPYEYEIIGSLPTSPSIISPRQSSAVFNINNGTIYSLIRLRTIDACGNAALNDVSILPLQNIQVKASNTCLYNTTLLTVDTIPNATYKWYYKRTETDSTLLDDSIVYNIPFLEPEQTGIYVCKVSVNNDCLTRLSYFDLTGYCGHTTLSNSFIQLKGKKLDTENQLSWSGKNFNYTGFVLEKRIEGSSEFVPLAKINKSSTEEYVFWDKATGTGNATYRLKVIATNNSYTNLVTLQWTNNSMQFYPNPARDKINISFAQSSITDYKIQLLNVAGQVLYQKQIKNGASGTYTYYRTSEIKPGMYLLRITDARGNIAIQKIIFE